VAKTFATLRLCAIKNITKNKKTSRPSAFVAIKKIMFKRLKKILQHAESFDFTSGSIRKGILILSIPMVLEMAMESVFALVDLYFVGHLKESNYAIQVVGLTESVFAIIYSIAIGISIATTAIVARRIGKKDVTQAGKSGVQAIVIAIAINVFISVFGFIYAEEILLLMGASAASVVYGVLYTKIMMGGSVFVMLIFLINGIFRGAGNAIIAMKSLWISNISNIILCPILINGFWFIPAMGVTGAAIATTIGRGIGVLYQCYFLFYGKGILKIKWSYFIPDFKLIQSIIKLATPGVLQYVIASCSWIFLANLVATTGGDYASSGYQTAIRIMMFFILPAWGLSNAVATLVGQNLGAQEIGRAEESVYKTAKYNMIFMGSIMLVCFFSAHYFISFFTDNQTIVDIAVKALQIMSIGFIFYGLGMVLNNTFNGAGDNWTPTWINVFGFWIFQVPFAYFLVHFYKMGPTGVFIAIPVAETLITILSVIVYRRGNWKRIAI